MDNDLALPIHLPIESYPRYHNYETAISEKKARCALLLDDLIRNHEREIGAILRIDPYGLSDEEVAAADKVWGTEGDVPVADLESQCGESTQRRFGEILKSLDDIALGKCPIGLPTMIYNKIVEESRITPTYTNDTRGILSALRTWQYHTLIGDQEPRIQQQIGRRTQTDPIRYTYASALGEAAAGAVTLTAGIASASLGFLGAVGIAGLGAILVVEACERAYKAATTGKPQGTVLYPTAADMTFRAYTWYASLRKKSKK